MEAAPLLSDLLLPICTDMRDRYSLPPRTGLTAPLPT